MVKEKGEQTRNYCDRARTNSVTPHERFRDILCNFGLSNPMYGVIRTNVLRETRLIGSYIASDMVFLAEMALAGEFYRVPEHLFFRRDHPQKSYRANPTIAQLSSFYGLKDTKAAQQLYWRLFLGYASSLR